MFKSWKLFRDKKVFTPQLKMLAFYQFATGFILWYALEKLFMKSLGFSTAQIVALVVLAYAAGILIELPSSVLSDRWSRTKTLALSLGAAWLSALVGGFTTEWWHYALAMILWATASAFYSGTFQALTYDILKEQGREKEYNHVTSVYGIIFSIALVLGVSLGGFVGDAFGFRAPYFATLLLIPFAAVMIWRMKEPTHHKQDQESTNLKHLVKAYRQIRHSKTLAYLLGLTVLGNFLIAPLVYEFDEFYLKQHGIPLELIGVGKVFITSVVPILITGIIIAWYKHASKLAFAAYACIIAGYVFAVSSDSPWLIGCLVFGVAAHSVISTWLGTASQHHIKSSERASTASLAGTLGGVSWLVVSPLVAYLLDGNVHNVILLAAFVAFICLLILIRIATTTGLAGFFRDRAAD